jgi:hypothetical protein
MIHSPGSFAMHLPLSHRQSFSGDGKCRYWISGAAVELSVILIGWLAPIYAGAWAADIPGRKTHVGIEGEMFTINGRPTYAGRTWHGKKIEGLLLNSRMVQAIFDDRNPDTVSSWAYPDTKTWDPDRNTREFVAAMPEWRKHGLLAVTINLQGGSPEGYSAAQPSHNSAFDSDGTLRPDYLQRLETVLDRADELGMVIILGLYYFGQDGRLTDEAAVKNGVERAVDWLN